MHSPDMAVYSFCFVGIVTCLGWLALFLLWRYLQHLRSRANYRRLVRQQLNTIVMPNSGRRAAFLKDRP